MLFIGKKKLRKIVEEIVRSVFVNELKNIDKQVVTACTDQIKTSFLETNKVVMNALKAMSTLEKNIEGSQTSIAYLSESINSLIQCFTALSARVKDIEDKLSVSKVTFTKNTTN